MGALAALLPGAFSWPAIGVAVFLHWLSGGIGITLGYHRLITHRSFEIPKWLEYALLFCGALACQGPLEWVAKHRMHHERADTAGDPYDRNGSFWWTHLGWVLHRLPCDRDIPRYTKDIARDPVYRFFNRSILFWQVALAGLLFSLGGWPFVVWGIFVRLVTVYHCTWFVNSAAHRWGFDRIRPVIGRQIAGGLLCSRTEKDGTTTITLSRGRPGRVCAGGKWI